MFWEVTWNHITSESYPQILLMEEILHHLGRKKPCKSWDFNYLHLNWWSPDFFHVGFKNLVSSMSPLGAYEMMIWAYKWAISPSYCWWKKSHSQPPTMYETLVNNGINYLSTGEGFLPSTVSTISFQLLNTAWLSSTFMSWSPHPVQSPRGLLHFLARESQPWFATVTCHFCQNKTHLSEFFALPKANKSAPENGWFGKTDPFLNWDSAYFQGAELVVLGRIAILGGSNLIQIYGKFAGFPLNAVDAWNPAAVEVGRLYTPVFKRF